MHILSYLFQSIWYGHSVFFKVVLNQGLLYTNYIIDIIYNYASIHPHSPVLRPTDKACFEQLFVKIKNALILI